MFVVFLDVEDNGAGDLDSTEQVLVSENKKHFGHSFVLLPQHIVVDETLVFNLLKSFSVSRVYIYLSLCKIVSTLCLFVSFILVHVKSISQREDIPIDLNVEHRKINVDKFKVDESQLVGFVRFGFRN